MHFLSISNVSFNSFKYFFNYRTFTSRTIKYNMKKYDFVIYGATGFTGQYVVEEVARVAQMEESKIQLNSKSFSWAIAGRNKGKLQESLITAQKETGFDLMNVGVLEVDNSNMDSISGMAAQASVIINCVGPYQKFGEPVIKACIEHKTSHVDLSGEPQFIEGMKLKYDKAAEEAGVHIVSCCGYDSIPADMGLCHMMKHFPGVINSAECFFRSFGGKGTSIHTGTMESAALVLANQSEIQRIRRELYPVKLAKPKFRKEKRGVIHKNTDQSQPFWALTLPSDEPMVLSSQRYFHEVYGWRPVQFQGFVSFRTFPQAFVTLLGAMYFMILCYFGWTRNLLLKYPEVLTAGVFTRKGAPRDALKSMSFTSTIVGKGWTEKLSNPVDEYQTPPDSQIILKISGPDPGYGATSLMLVASAMTILREKTDCARKGGVMTPGAAFMNTGIMDRLKARGMKIELEMPTINEK